MYDEAMVGVAAVLAASGLAESSKLEASILKLYYIEII